MAASDDLDTVFKSGGGGKKKKKWVGMSSREKERRRNGNFCNGLLFKNLIINR